MNRVELLHVEGSEPCPVRNWFLIDVSTRQTKLEFLTKVEDGRRPRVPAVSGGNLYRGIKGLST